jgi:anti-sigma factor RsiW
MTLTTEHPSDELLQRHFDGDLDPAETNAVQAHLAGCQPCAARRRALERLHALMATTLGAASKHVEQEADFAGLYERIESGIQSDTEPGAGKVVDLASRKRARAVVAYVVTAAAAAAAVVITVFHPGSNSQRPEAVTGSEQQAATPEAATVHGRSEVVNVDFGSNAGTVFEISLADGSSTPVVWINDDE